MIKGIYDYNEQNRLMTTVNTSGEKTRYVYDKNGNLTDKTAGRCSKQTIEALIAADKSNLPKFDLIIRKDTDNGTGSKDLIQYSYDKFNRLSKLKDEDSTATYKYNAQGYRVKKTMNGKTTDYLYEGDKVVLETDKDNNQKAVQVYGNSLLSRSVASDNGKESEKYFYLYNAHGDVTSLIKPTGGTAVSYDYDAFGNITNKTGDADNSTLYAGYQHDDESGLYYLNARYYDSVTARFITEDSYTGEANDPLSLNLYTYCSNNPMIYDDPSGHKKEDKNKTTKATSKKTATSGKTTSGKTTSGKTTSGKTSSGKTTSGKTTSGKATSGKTSTSKSTHNVNSNANYTTSEATALIEKLKSQPNNVNYQKLLDIIDEHGVTNFTSEVIQSIVDSETRGTLESTQYILGNNFKYLADYNGESSYANFYVLMVDGEITLIRVGRDKTQVGFYDITKTDFFDQEYDNDKRGASSIFDDYLPTTGLDQNLNSNDKLSNKNYKFYENKATHTADIFWKNLKSDSEVIMKMARGLDTIKGVEDNTGTVTDFGDVYKKTKYYPQKNNVFVLGEIYGHAAGLNASNLFWVAGKHKYRYWVADVENPNTIPTDWITRQKQYQQNKRWKKYGKGR